MNELYEYLDGYQFVNYSEVLCAVQDYYEQHYAEHNSSYGDLVKYGELADEYCLDRQILGFDDLADLKDKIEELEEFTYGYNYGYNEVDNYMKACELCGVDPRENGDLTDKECLIEEIKQKVDDGNLQGIKGMLEDIDLDNSYFMYDGNGRPRNIERSDSEYVIEDKLRELRQEYENTLDILRSGE